MYLTLKIQACTNIQYEELADEYNSSYDYVEASGNKDRSILQHIGGTILDLFEKPIEWVSPSSASEKTFQRTEALDSLNSYSLLNSSTTRNRYPLTHNYNREEDSLDSLKDDNGKNLSSESHKNAAHDEKYSTEQYGTSLWTNENRHSL